MKFCLRILKCSTISGGGLQIPMTRDDAMNKILSRAGIGFHDSLQYLSKAGRVFALGAGCAVLLWSSVAVSETILERGRYLVNGVVACGNCHTPPAGQLQGVEFAGTFLIEFPEFTAYAPNITPDPETGIGKWTDEQLIKAIREGVRPDGSIIGPPMPIGLYRGLSDPDVKAIVEYMRTVKPVRNAVPNSEFRIQLPDSYGPPVANVADVSTNDVVAYGAYLAGPAGHCIECHTPMGEHGHPDFENRLGSGGFAFPGPWGVSVSRNITPHPAAGIGAWTDDEIKAAITSGVRRDGSQLKPPMGFHYYKNINDRDLDAIVAYLRSLPAKQ